MRITCHVHDESKQSVSDALVSISSMDEKHVWKLTYNKSESCYETDADVMVGEQVILEVAKKGCEVIRRTVLTDTTTQLGVRIGKKGVRYARFGNYVKPLKTYEDLIGAMPVNEDGLKLLEELGYELVSAYEERPLEGAPVFRKRMDMLSGKNEKKRNRELKDDLKRLRKSAVVSVAGPISRFTENGTDVFTNKLVVRFLEGMEHVLISGIVWELGLQIYYINSFGEYILEAAPDTALDIFDLVDDLYDTGAVKSVVPETISFSNRDTEPGNLLWGGQYVDKVIDTAGAWGEIALVPGIPSPFGLGDIIVCVNDNGLNPTAGVQNPSFSGQILKKGGILEDKIYKLQDFTPPFYPANNNNTRLDGSGNKIDHGINVCSIVSASADVAASPGVTGIAPNTRLMSIITLDSTDAEQVDALYWSAGNKAIVIGGNNFPKLDEGFDVQASSISFTHSSSYNIAGELEDKFGRLINDLLIYGRNGRGALMVFSGGNFNRAVTFQSPVPGGPAVSNRLSAYPGTLAIGATTFYPDYPGQERKTMYSATGKIDFCAPSSSAGTGFGVHNPVMDIGTWVATFQGDGNLPGALTQTKTVLQPVVESNPVLEQNCTVRGAYPKAHAGPPSIGITANINAGGGTIHLASAVDFSDDMWIRIDNGGVSEFVHITVKAGNSLTVNPATPVLNAYVIAGTTITGYITIEVANSAAYRALQPVILEYVQMGFTRLYDSVQVVHSALNRIAVDGVAPLPFDASDHEFDINSSLTIRQSTKLGTVNFGAVALPANYNPTGAPTANIVVNAATIPIANWNSFKGGTYIHIETAAGNSEWVKITGAAGGNIQIDPLTPVQFAHNSATTTITGYPAVSVQDPLNFNVGDWIVLELNLANFFYTKVLYKDNNSLALQKSPFAIAIVSTNAEKVIPIQLNNTVGLAPDDKVLLGDPEFDLATRSENSEIVTIAEVVAAENLVLTRRIIHAHGVIPARNLYKGAMDYKSSFGGTSSACPVAAGTIALMLSANPDLTWAEIKDILKETAEKIDVHNKGYELPVDNITGLSISGGLSTYRASTSAIRPLGQGRWKNKLGQYIYDLDGVTPLVADIVPVFSEWYGYGRINTFAAVAMARAYDQNERDLVIRDTMADTGTAANPVNLQIDSPDVWVRNIDPATDALVIGAVAYGTAGPHQPPLKGSDRHIYARIKNIGGAKASLQATVRFFLVLDNPGTAFQFPEHFTEGGNVAAGLAGVKLLGEVALAEGDLAPGAEKKVHILWPKDASDVNTSLETNILVEVTPHDGPYFDTAKTGKLLGDNNNTTRKRITFAENIEIRATGGTLPANIAIPSTAITTPVTTAFQVFIRDLNAFTTENAKITAKIFHLGGGSEEVVFRYNAGAWSFDSAPTGGWVTLQAPLKEPFAPADTAAGPLREIRFDGTFTVTNADDKISLKAEYTDSTAVVKSSTKEVGVTIQYVSNTAVTAMPTEKNKVYFFTEYDKLTPVQPAADAYGPDSVNPTTAFNVTSKHTATIDVKAFAVTDGQIIVQKTSDPTLVNVILKPSNQGVVDFLNVKYFVYRGIKIETLIDSGNPDRIAATGTNAFVTSIWTTQAKINQAIENADPDDTITPGSVTDEPPSKALGIQYVNSVVLPGDILKTDLDTFDDIFFDVAEEYQFPVISKGQEFGLFKSSSIGFDVVLHGMNHKTTFGDVRGTALQIAATVLAPGAPLINQLQNRTERSRVLNYMDPAAFYGVHLSSGVNSINNAGSDDLWANNDLYDNVLKYFANKNRLYIDIRNENGYSFNYYGNYTESLAVNNDIGLSLDGTVTPAQQVFGTSGWPIQIVENAGFAAGNTSNKNRVRVALPKGNNNFPLLYESFAIRLADFPKQAPRNKKFDPVVFGAGAAYSDTIELATPNKSGGAGTEAIVSYIQLVYIRRNQPGNTAGGFPASVFGDHALDNVFPMIEPVPWDTTDDIRFISGYHSRFIESPAFSFIGDIGIALEPSRVVLYAVPEEIHFQAARETRLYKRILGGTSNKDSFFQVLLRSFPGFTLTKKELTIAGNPKWYLMYDDEGSVEKYSIDKRNFYGVGMTRTEFDSLVTSANAANLDFDLHFPTLVVKDLQEHNDDTGKGYFEYKLGIAGIDNSGAYTIAAGEVKAYSVDGVMITSSDFAQAETGVSLTTNCIKFNGSIRNGQYAAAVGSVIKRLSLFTDINGTTKRSWEMYTDMGTPMVYSSGEVSNLGETLSPSDPVVLPVGTRVVLLDCADLGVSTLGSLHYKRVVAFYNGDFHEGYVSEFAFTNSKKDRVLPTDDVTDDEIFDALINDIRHDTVMARRLYDDPTKDNAYLPNADFDNLVTILENELDALAFNSIVGKWNAMSPMERTGWISLLKDSGQLGLQFDYYYDVSGRRINVPATLDKFNALIGSVIPYNNPAYTYQPFNGNWSGMPGVYKAYNGTIEAYAQNNFPAAIFGNLSGNSGYTMKAGEPTEYIPSISGLKDLRAYLSGQPVNGWTVPAGDPVLQTPEAEWMLRPEHSDNFDGLGNDYFDSINTLLAIFTDTWGNPAYPDGLTTDFRSATVGIDNSLGFVNSNNVLSVMIHELNVSSLDVLKLADDTHSYNSEVPFMDNDVEEKKLVSETSWEYVRDHDFATFNAHGFQPAASYTDGSGHQLGRQEYSATRNICDFLQRNPSIGVIYAKHIINKLKGI